MANRTAAFRAKYLTREPKVLVGKFTVVNAANGAVTTAEAPFNEGIKSITHTGTGVYKISFGTNSTVDPYYKLGPVVCTFDEKQRHAYVTNDQASNSTTPFVELTVDNGAGTAVNVTNAKSCTFEILFLDSAD